MANYSDGIVIPSAGFIADFKLPVPSPSLFESTAASSSIPPSTSFLLTTSPQIISTAIPFQLEHPSHSQSDHINSEQPPETTDSEMREKQMIETPDFKLRDIDEFQSKTRGSRITVSIYSERSGERACSRGS